MIRQTISKCMFVDVMSWINKINQWKMEKNVKRVMETEEVEPFSILDVFGLPKRVQIQNPYQTNCRLQFATWKVSYNESPQRNLKKHGRLSYSINIFSQSRPPAQPFWSFSVLDKGMLLVHKYPPEENKTSLILLVSGLKEVQRCSKGTHSPLPHGIVSQLPSLRNSAVLHWL